MNSKKSHVAIPPPSHLSPRAAELWRAIVPERACSAGRIALVQTALEALDRANEFRAQIAVDGLTVKTKRTGAVHVHPCVAHELKARSQFAAIMHALKLEWGSEDVN